MPTELLIGKVFHYDDEKGVAYLELSGELLDGQVLRFKDPDGDFYVTVRDMHITGQIINYAELDDFVAIPVDHKLHEQDEVFVQY